MFISWGTPKGFWRKLSASHPLYTCLMSAFPDTITMGISFVLLRDFTCLQISKPDFPGKLMSNSIRSGLFSKMGLTALSAEPVITLKPFRLSIEDIVRRKSGSSSITAISLFVFTRQSIKNYTSLARCGNFCVRLRIFSYTISSHVQNLPDHTCIFNSCNRCKRTKIAGIRNICLKICDTSKSDGGYSMGLKRSRER